ncbi:NUDIX hydrolase [Candidatus Woesearchaeota archaeon]|nr:NUDIX hydrolase [Candidatus Woesearchaeota archaeon]
MEKATIPPRAGKVFSGVMFDVYHWKQELLDGSTATWEMLRRADTVLVLSMQNDKILLSRQEQPLLGEFYALFGGIVDGGETPEAAAKRELLEEAGLHSDDWEYVKGYRYTSKIDFTGHLFIARDCKQAAEQRLDAGGERIDVVSKTFEEFLGLVKRDDFRNKEVALELLRMRPEELEAFKKKLFP